MFRQALCFKTATVKISCITSNYSSYQQKTEINTTTCCGHMWRPLLLCKEGMLATVQTHEGLVYWNIHIGFKN